MKEAGDIPALDRDANRVLLCETSRIERARIRRALNRFNLPIETCDSGAAVSRALCARMACYRVLILSHPLPGMDSRECIRLLAGIKFAGLLMIIWGGESPEPDFRYVDAGVCQMLRKPVDLAVMRSAVLCHLKRHRA